MIPKWKLRREAARLKELTFAWFGKVYEPYWKHRHDRWRDSEPIPQDLGIALTGKIAIFLIFQPKGIAPSIFTTLRWLVANGYAPLVIANTLVSDKDHLAISALAWRLFQRPNFGYDFGGYRDGVLLIKAWGIEPDRLLIINDSVWMPTHGDSTLLARLEAVDADVTGGIIHQDTIRRNGEVRRGHLESYLYLVNRRAINSPAFIKFWTTYPVSSNRLNAVHRGERRFAYVMSDAHLSVEGLFSRITFLKKISLQDNVILNFTLQYAAYIEPQLAEENRALLAKKTHDDDWRDGAMDHIRRTVERRRFNAVFPYPADALFGMDFIKKSLGSIGDGGASLHSRMRRQFLCAVAKGDLPPLVPEVQAEIDAQEKRIG